MKYDPLSGFTEINVSAGLISVEELMMWSSTSVFKIDRVVGGSKLK